MRFSRMRMLVVGVVAMLGTTAAAAEFTAENPATSGGVVVAQFASAAPLVNGNEVKIDGVVVGKVIALKTGARGKYADVVLGLKPAAFPLHRDATLRIRSVSLLGERYIDLERGSPSAPVIKAGEPIPLSQTGTTVGIDQILNVLDKPTSKGLAFLITTLGDGLRGNGDNAAATIRTLVPALRDTRALTGVLRDQNDLLNRLLDRVQPVAAGLAAGHGKAMDRLVGAAERLLSATSEQQRYVDETIAELPSTLASARTTLARLEGTANEATPTLRGMRPVTDNLATISDELTRFADSLDPALAAATPVLERAEMLLDSARPVAKDLRAAGPGLRSSVTAARPIVRDLSANLDNVFNFIRYWALATNGRDGLSHYFRFNFIVNDALATGLLPTDDSSPARTPKVPDAVPTPTLPGLPPVTGLLRPHVNDDDLPSREGGVTGLSPEQEKGLAGLLLGGGS